MQKMCGEVCILVLSVIAGAMHVSPLLGQTESDEALAVADRLLELGSYDAAITEYKRFIFFNPRNERTGYALHRMGLAYRAGYNWQEAIDALRASILAAGRARHASPLRIADERRIVLATTLIASGNYSLARLELLKVSESSEHPSLRFKSLYFIGIASLYMFDWDAAGEALGDFYSVDPTKQMTQRAKEIDSVLLKVRQSHKSVRLAEFLSTIFPGLGQIYAGDWRDGLNALALNCLTMGFLANAIYRRDCKDAVLISSISIRYYMGNIYRAEMDVRKYNESLDRRNAAKVLSLVRADEPT
jgi:tetratricopeptide (TPR) repeat protein